MPITGVQAQTMHKFTWATCDAFMHKAHDLWQQEISVSQLESFVRDFEGRVAAAADPTASAQSAEH